MATTATALYHEAIQRNIAGDKSGAIACLLDAIKMKPGYASAYLKLASIYASLHEYDNAKIAYVEYLRYRPNDSGALFQLGRCYLHLNDTDAAANVSERLRHLDTKKADVLDGDITRLREEMQSR